MLVLRTITLIKAKLPILQLKHSRSIALGPHYNTYVKIVGGGAGRKKGKQLKCGGGIVKPYGENNCALRGKSTKFGMVIMFGLLNNLRNGKRAACNHGVMDARGRLLSTKEA